MTSQLLATFPFFLEIFEFSKHHCSEITWTIAFKFLRDSSLRNLLSIFSTLLVADSLEKREPCANKTKKCKKRFLSYSNFLNFLNANILLGKLVDI